MDGLIEEIRSLEEKLGAQTVTDLVGKLRCVQQSFSELLMENLELCAENNALREQLGIPENAEPRGRGISNYCARARDSYDRAKHLTTLFDDGVFTDSQTSSVAAVFNSANCSPSLAFSARASRSRLSRASSS